MSGPIVITCKLAIEQRPALEKLLFFNANQHRVRSGIEQSIAIYGAPEIYAQEDSLHIRVGDLDAVQTLFAVSADGRPVGIAVFARLTRERFVVLHLGVEPKPRARDANTAVLLRLMHEIRGAARRDSGAARVELVYRERHALRLPVSSAARSRTFRS